MTKASTFFLIASLSGAVLTSTAAVVSFFSVSVMPSTMFDSVLLVELTGTLLISADALAAARACPIVTTPTDES